MNHSKNILIVGASRGLGDAFSRGLGNSGDALWLVSRNKPDSLEIQDEKKRTWIKADLSQAGAAKIIATELASGFKDQPLEACIYNAGIWEENAFTNNYNFEKTEDAITQQILQVNLISAITTARAVMPLMQQAAHPKIIFIGSINGLANTRMPEVAYNASKWGLRGATQALRELARPKGVAVSIINPGSIGDAVHDTNGKYLGAGIPYADLIELTNCILSMSNRSVVKEVHLPAMLDPFV